jgi:hypothetical protein
MREVWISPDMCRGMNNIGSRAYPRPGCGTSDTIVSLFFTKYYLLITISGNGYMWYQDYNEST